MSTEMHNKAHGRNGEARHADVSFEKADVQATTIYWYLGALSISVILSYLVCIFVLRTTTKVAEGFDTPPPMVRQEMGNAYDAMPPEPRLQGVPGHRSDPQSDLREKNRLDTEANQKVGWIDQNAGVAQIPVEDAMKIIAEKGLPGVPPAQKK
jgi:hypothetical protein